LVRLVVNFLGNASSAMMGIGGSSNSLLLFLSSMLQKTGNSPAEDAAASFLMLTSGNSRAGLLCPSLTWLCLCLHHRARMAQQMKPHATSKVQPPPAAGATMLAGKPVVVHMPLQASDSGRA